MKYQLAGFADEASNSFDGQIRALKENKIGLLEIRNLDKKNIADLSISEAREAKAKLDAEGLAVWSIGSRLGKIAVDADFATHLDELKHTLELADALGCANIRMFSFYVPTGVRFESVKDTVFERLEAFVDTAKGSGIKLCHENEKGIYGDIPERCLEIAQTFKDIGTVFDPANYVQCSADTLKAWEMLKKYVTYMHIKDSLPDGRIVPAGKGVGQIEALVKAYFAQGGSVLTLEPHLFGFEGLGTLENKTIGSDHFAYTYASGEEAFASATGALREIIEKF